MDKNKVTRVREILLVVVLTVPGLLFLLWWAWKIFTEA